MNNTFIMVYDWMLDYLKGNDLIVFALVYSLGETIGQKYISERTHIPIENVSRSLAHLEKMKFIRIEVEGRTKKFIPTLDELSIVDESSIDVSSSKHLTNHQVTLDVSSSKHLTNHQVSLYIDKNRIRIDKNRDKNKGTRLDIDILFSDFKISPDDDLKESILGFIEHRKKIKKPMTQRALKQNFKEAYKLADGNPQTMTRIFDQSVARGWAGVFALKEGGNHGQNADEDFFADVD